MNRSDHQQQLSPLHSQLVKAAAVTHPSLRIRNLQDAHVVLEAVRLNILPLLKRNLTDRECDELCSGHVYVWEETRRDVGLHLRRWRDARKWSGPRKKFEGFYYFKESVVNTKEERYRSAARGVRRASHPQAIVSPAIRRQKNRPDKPNGLTKQTYTARVHIPGKTEPLKWHIVAYFSAYDCTRLPVVEDYPYLRSIRLPNGTIFPYNTKDHLSGNKRFSTSSSACPSSYAQSGPYSYSDASKTHDNAYLSFSASTCPPHSNLRGQYPDEHAFPMSTLPLYVSSYTPSLLSPENPSHDAPWLHSRSLSTHPSRQTGEAHTGKIQLPPLSPLRFRNYAPLTEEDKRALDKLKVVL